MSLKICAGAAKEGLLLPHRVVSCPPCGCADLVVWPKDKHGGTSCRLSFHMD